MTAPTATTTATPIADTTATPVADTIELGGVTITRVVEWSGPIAPAAEVFPEPSRREWERHRTWLEPDFVEPATGYFNANAQTWVLRSEGRVVLVDTGLGNDKERPYAPPWSRLDTDFLGRLRAAGVEREDVDLVINTHVHADHVGWNTVLVDREWVPTFPNADYLIPRADFFFWNPLNTTPKRGSLGGIDQGLGNLTMYQDSVQPVYDHGQAVLWEEHHRIDANLCLEATPGHTPGTSILNLESGGERAMFVGDVMHSPMQVVRPDTEACLSEDAPAAIRQRRRLLERAADTKSLVLPAHFPGRGALEVKRDGDAFAIETWAPFASVP